jgi:hypothetical protein
LISKDNTLLYLKIRFYQARGAKLPTKSTGGIPMAASSVHSAIFCEADDLRLMAKPCVA